MNQKTYEGMFLLDAGNDFQAASEPVRNILNRYEAGVLAMKLWDERKLAYEISGRKRGAYILSYFKLDPSKVVEIEHDCRLDERFLRVLILRKDRLSQTELEAETPASLGVRVEAEATAEAAPLAVEEVEAAVPEEAAEQAEEGVAETE